MSERRRCTRCANAFDGEPWQRLCWSCWRERKDAEQRHSEYERGWHAGRVAAVPRQGALDSTLLRDVISLCHPDRHPVERYELANATTARLLALRGELAA